MEEERFRQLKDALDSDPDNPAHHFNLGLLLWEKGEKSNQLKEKAVEHFVISARLNPNNGVAFRLLGHYYSRVSVDSQRAARCYQRAVTLNPDDYEAGEGLCDLLDGEGKEILEVSVCREASKKSPRAFWAFRRLGYMQVHQKKWSEAVQSLQHAIRGYPSCSDLWEALGLAYQRLGMFTAALKSYGRAIELENSSVFALVESGNILLMLGSFKKGAEQFQNALKIVPNNVAAQYGLASALLGLSQDSIKSGAYFWAASLLEEASEIAKASTCLAGNNSSVWKLLGDIKLAYAKSFPWVSEGQNREIDESSFKTSILEWKKERVKAAVNANRSYQKALHLTPWQANIYTDVAIALDLISSEDEKNTSQNSDLEAWQLPEKMSLGGLMLEAGNSEVWIVLGCLSYHKSLKQHALIRGLQLDVSLAAAWAFLGKLYRQEGERFLARQAFDLARSIDPSLALPWAGMSIDTYTGGSINEAYESCLRAVQTLPVPEFQLGLGNLSLSSGQLLAPQVFCVLRQAVHLAPHYPESHNLSGLVYEARGDYQSAIAAYRQAQYACRCFVGRDQMSGVAHASFNLARSLCEVGYALEAANECQVLQKEGLLDDKGLQVYAVALWKLGRTEQSLSMARSLAKSVSTMNQTSGLAATGLILKLVYCISGQKAAASSILKTPRNLMHSVKISYILSVLVTLDQSGQLRSFLPSDLSFISSHEEITSLHSLIAIVKLVVDGSQNHLGIQSGVDYLRKTLHMYPDSISIRNQLGLLLLQSEVWNSSHSATRCIVLEHPRPLIPKVSTSGNEVIGSAAVACHVSSATNLKSSFATCADQRTQGTGILQQLQKWLREEPWNHKALYLLVLSFLQKAREEKFPPHLCVIMKRLVVTALSNEVYSRKDQHYQYQKFQLLLSASEICLQGGDHLDCISYATDASQLPLPSCDLFFAHLQLCRAYALQEDFSKLKEEYIECVQLGTDKQCGWISLKYIECRYKVQNNENPINLRFERCLQDEGTTSKKWMAIYDLVCAQSFLWDQNFLQAERVLAHACSLGVAESCLLLLHGLICLELAKQRSGSEFLSLAVSSLTKAKEFSLVCLPIVSVLLAQAEASLGARTKWEDNLRLEWFSWPAEMRPAELYFQMHLLAKQSKVASGSHSNVEALQSPQRWILRAIHINPSCARYWKVLERVKE
ncbi:tetratricopeptide repeat protein SKI3 [Aristolochia californica]|uniref:tetratricopeptide repeat protein SKI3 n=1 Tax=Aristolochia californica TaxID=171875 RepID=UPI0035E01D66